MSKTIFFFVKVFTKKTHAEDFLRGTLYSNRLAFFKKLEEDTQANRSDRHEAVVGWYQPDRECVNGYRSDLFYCFPLRLWRQMLL